jgi:hypothetical protein
VKETTLNTYFEPSVFKIQNNFQINAEPAKKVFKTVKSRNQSGLERIFNENKTMTAGEFLVFFNPLELVKILQLNKASHYLMQEIVNF